MELGNIRAAVVQVNSGAVVPENLERVEAFVSKAASEGAGLVVVPENFAFMGPESEKVGHGERLGQGPITKWGLELAEKLGIELLLGGLPEKSPDPKRVYNTACLVTPEGIQALYRKIHLFDVDVPGGPRVMESEATVAGREVVAARRPWGVLGLSICYDLRFPELYRELVARGAHVLAVPAGFTRETGAAHWEILVRARAVENQCYVLAANLTGHHFGARWSYGHSLIVDPWGRVLAGLGEEEGFCLADLKADVLVQVRRSLPALAHRVLGRSESR